MVHPMVHPVIAHRLTLRGEIHPVHGPQGDHPAARLAIVGGDGDDKPGDTAAGKSFGVRVVRARLPAGIEPGLQMTQQGR